MAPPTRIAFGCLLLLASACRRGPPAPLPVVPERPATALPAPPVAPAPRPDAATVDAVARVVAAPGACISRWPSPLALGAARGTLHIAAHDAQAQVVLPQHRDAYEGMDVPMGDSMDSERYSVVTLDRARPANAPSPTEDRLPTLEREEGESVSIANAMAATVWTPGGFARLRAAGAWGSAACTPRGGFLDLVRASNPMHGYGATLLTHELAASAAGEALLGVWLGVQNSGDGGCVEGPSLQLFAATGNSFARATLLRMIEGRSPAVDAVAVAARADGGAVLWREDHRRLVLALVNRAGHAQGARRVLVDRAPEGSQPGVGAPAVAWLGEQLVVLWAERAAPRSPYRLRYLQWEPRSAPPEPAWARPEGTDHQLAPSLSSDGDGLALAWCEGDTSRRGAIFAAHVQGSAAGLATAPALRVSSEAATNARDPEVGLAGSLLWTAWLEFRGARDGVAHVLLAECGNR